MTEQPAETTQVRTVAVDFDGVVHGYSKGWHDGTIYDGPKQGAIEALRVLMGRFAVFIHTTRDVYDVALWLGRYGFECEAWPALPPAEFWNTQGVLLVTSRKLPAVAYIDDRAVRFRNWTQTFGELAELGLMAPVGAGSAAEPQSQPSAQQRGVSSSSSSTSWNTDA